MKMTEKNQIPPVRMAILTFTNNKYGSELGVRKPPTLLMEGTLTTTTIKDNVGMPE